MFGSFGWMELLLILIIVLIIFGAGKIPQLGEGLGKAIKGFKKSVNEPDAVDITPAQQAEGQPGMGQQTPAQQVPPPQTVATEQGQVQQGQPQQEKQG